MPERVASGFVGLSFTEETGVLNALGLAVFVTDRHGVVTFVNDASLELGGAGRENLLGSRLDDLLAGPGSDSAEVVRAGVAQALAGTSWHSDLEAVISEGESRQLGVSAMPILGDDGVTVTGLAVLAEPLTAVRQAEAATAASERRLRLAYDAAELGSWHWDMATGIVVWDERLEAIFGLNPGGYDGTFETWLAMIHPEDRDDVMQIVTDAVEDRSSYNLNVRVVHPDGSVHWIESLGRVTTTDAGDPTGTIGCVWDTTVKREVERELEAAFEAQRQASALAESMSEEREQLMLRLSEIADHLQTSLAASPIPDVDGVSIAVHYAPGGDELEHVGGDWYDAVRTSEGGLAVVVGDVMGRGVRAATTMVRVRAGIRGLLTVDASPDVVLAHADTMIERDAPEQFVTAVAVLVDPASRRLTMCNAGHVPVVLTRPDGAIEILGDGTGVPLGISQGGERLVIDKQLEPGCTVVIVTDGVVEGRGYDIDEGVARLSATVSELAQAPAGELVQRVATLADRSLRDDVTVVAVRLH